MIGLTNQRLKFVPLVLVFALAVNVAFVPTIFAQTPATNKPNRPAPVRTHTAGRNQEVARIVAEIDARNIERTIRTLVSFGTRNTLSEQDNPKRGIGAARDWLYNEFSKVAEQSGGRMTVEKQTYIQEAQPPPRGRVPKPTLVTNI